MGWNWGGALKGGLGGAGAGFLAGGVPGAIAGGVAGFGLGGMSSSNPYTRLGSPGDVSNVNPYTKQMLDQMLADRNYFKNWMESGQSQTSRYGSLIDDQIQNIGKFNFTSSYDPLAAQRQFLGQSPELQHLVDRSYGMDQAQEQAKLLAARSAQEVAAQFGNQGAINSGAALKAMSEGAAAPMAQYLTDAERMRNQLLSGLWDRSFSGLQQGNIFAAQQDLATQQENYARLLNMLQALQAQQAMGFNQQQLGSNLYGQTGAMLGQYGAPQWWQPTYVGNPNYINPMDMLGMGAQIGMLTKYFPSSSKPAQNPPTDSKPATVDIRTNQNPYGYLS
jgi:hypothetical protein